METLVPSLTPALPSLFPGSMDAGLILPIPGIPLHQITDLESQGENKTQSLLELGLGFPYPICVSIVLQY